MKILFFIPILGLALLSISCQIITPLDPNTMEPSARCMPPGTPVVHYSGK